MIRCGGISGKKMFENKSEKAAREEILSLVREYAEAYHVKKKAFTEGDRIPYASRVYDGDEMVNLVDSALEFWLTAGRYTEEFERKLGEYLGIYAPLWRLPRRFWETGRCGAGMRLSR